VVKGGEVLRRPIDFCRAFDATDLTDVVIALKNGNSVDIFYERINQPRFTPMESVSLNFPVPFGVFLPPTAASRGNLFRVPLSPSPRPLQRIFPVSKASVTLLL
jgi:hypothetical protein